MPIIGIDYDKCINCKTCLSACTDPETYFKEDKEQDRIIFEDPSKGCIQCGQCIAQCPEDAIIYEKMGESFTFKEIDGLENLIPPDTMHNFLAANRSCRRYKKEKVPDDILKKVLDAMNCAPTAANMRTENFYVISDEKLKMFSDAIIESFLADPATRDSWEEKIELHGDKYPHPLYYDAPHVIVVSSTFNMMMEGCNLGIIITYGRLIAQSLGLGTCWNGYTQIAIHHNPKIKKIAGIRGLVAAAFTIGYPDVDFHRVSPRSPKRIKGFK